MFDVEIKDVLTVLFVFFGIIGVVVLSTGILIKSNHVEHGVQAVYIDKQGIVKQLDSDVALERSRLGSGDNIIQLPSIDKVQVISQCDDIDGKVNYKVVIEYNNHLNPETYERLRQLGIIKSVKSDDVDSQSQEMNMSYDVVNDNLRNGVITAINNTINTILSEAGVEDLDISKHVIQNRLLKNLQFLLNNYGIDNIKISEFDLLQV